MYTHTHTYTHHTHTRAHTHTTSHHTHTHIHTQITRTTHTHTHTHTKHLCSTVNRSFTFLQSYKRTRFLPPLLSLGSDSMSFSQSTREIHHKQHLFLSLKRDVVYRAGAGFSDPKNTERHDRLTDTTHYRHTTRHIRTIETSRQGNMLSLEERSEKTPLSETMHKIYRSLRNNLQKN